MADTEPTDALTRPIIGIEYRTPQEVFDIMCDRVMADRRARPSTAAVPVAEIEVMEPGRSNIYVILSSTELPAGKHKLYASPPGESDLIARAVEWGIDGLLDAYWGLAYDQGREDTGVDAYSAERTRIRTAIRSRALASAKEPQE